jgi:hypothetical protein
MKANYIIFHPDSERDKVTVKALALVNNKLDANWIGDVFVDKIGIGNEDPFVFSDPWLYSYCHATQLKRNVKNGDSLQPGSIIIFVSGQAAEKGLLSVDTVFLIADLQKWNRFPSLEMPLKYVRQFKDNKSMLWNRHFRYPFDGCHTSVTYTYEAKLWNNDKNGYSFLPINNEGLKVTLRINDLSTELTTKILNKVRGKYPVCLTDKEVSEVVGKISNASFTKVLKINSCTKDELLDFKTRKNGVDNKKGCC